MENHRRARLIVISGLPGTGKSTVAQRVAATLPAAHVSIDEVEEALLACGVERGWTAGVAAYEAASAAAVTSLKAGVDVVIDAVNDSEPARRTWRRAARDAGADLHFSLLVCSDPAIHRSRLDGRNRGLAHVGEPSWDATLQRHKDYAPWGDPHLLIDTAFSDADEVVGELLTSLPRCAAPGAPHHIEMRVQDLESSTATWGWLLGQLGYTEFQRWPMGISWILGGTYVVLEQAPSSLPHDRRGAGLSHVAFSVGSPSELDQLWEDAPACGWSRLYEDRYPYAGGPDHYAAYLENAERFKVELVAEQGLA